MKNKRLIALGLASLFIMSALVGCTPKDAPPTDPVTPDNPAVVTPVSDNIYRTYLSAEAPILNGHNSVDNPVQTPHNYCSSPLFRTYPNENGMGFHYIGDIASELPIQIDDYNWQIKIRKEAKWQNGDPINADTFMYSWKMLLDPLLANKMSDFLASYNITIVNAQEYALQGTANTVAWEDVGIKKIDDYTIQLTTVDKNDQNTVCSQFQDRSTYPVYEPYYEAGMSADRTSTTYGTTLDKWMGCGPYIFDKWEYDSMHIYKKNPDHWLADLYHYDAVEVRIIPNMNARVELWEQGKLDDFIPDSNTMETYLDDPRMHEYPSLTVYHIDINSKNPTNPIGNTVEYRKAMYHAIDRNVISEKVFGHMQPAGTYISGMAGILSPDGLTFRESPQGKTITDLIESWGPAGYNPKLALEYLDKAYDAVGLSKDTVITLKFAVGDTETAWKATAEYLMEQFPVIFNNRVKLEIVTYAGMGATDFKKTGDDKWDFSPNDWTRGAARPYPHTSYYYYLKSYSSSPNNYFSERFEKQYEICDAAELKNDYKKLYDETQKLEEIYLEDVIHVPVVQEVMYQMFSDRLKLPVKTYIPVLGFGTMYGEIVK